MSGCYDKVFQNRKKYMELHEAQLKYAGFDTFNTLTVVWICKIRKPNLDKNLYLFKRRFGLFPLFCKERYIYPLHTAVYDTIYLKSVMQRPHAHCNKSIIATSAIIIYTAIIE